MTTIVDESPPARDQGAPGRGWLLWPMLLLLGYLLFAHGCHGDEDNELFMRLRNGIIPVRQPGP